MFFYVEACEQINRGMFVPGSKIDQEDYRAVLGVYERRVEALRLFVLLSFAIETCGMEETFFLPPALSHPPTGSRSRFLLLYVADCFL